MSLAHLWMRFRIYFKVTYLLIALNIVMFLITLLITPFLNGNNQYALLLLGAEYTPGIIEGELWRLLVSSFLHANIFHLLVNTWALFNIGEVIENFYGGRKLFTTYVLTAIVASIVSMFVHLGSAVMSQNPSEAYSISVGASGAVFGMVGLILGNRFKSDTYSLRIDTYFNTSLLWIFVGYNILLGFGVNLLGSSISVDNWAHLGGLVAGLVAGIFFEPINSFNTNKIKLILEKSLFYFSIIIMILSFLALIISILL